MVVEDNITKLKKARDMLAKVYEEEAKDDKHDNGNLISIHNAIIGTEDAIKAIEERNK